MQWREAEWTLICNLSFFWCFLVRKSTLSKLLAYRLRTSYLCTFWSRIYLYLYLKWYLKNYKDAWNLVDLCSFSLWSLRAGTNSRLSSVWCFSTWAWVMGHTWGLRSLRWLLGGKGQFWVRVWLCEGHFAEQTSWWCIWLNQYSLPPGLLQPRSTAAWLGKSAAFSFFFFSKWAARIERRS